MSEAWRDTVSDEPEDEPNPGTAGSERMGLDDPAETLGSHPYESGWDDSVVTLGKSLSVAGWDDPAVTLGEAERSDSGLGDLEDESKEEEPYAPAMMKIPVPVVVPAGRKLVGLTIPDSCMVYRVACDPGAVSVGDRLLVQVSDGEVVATIRHIFELPSEPYPGPIRRVVRRLNDKDLRFLEWRAEQELKAQRICRERIRELKLPMKLSKVGYPLGGNKAIIHFTSEERIDFRDLVRLLSADLRVRVEMRHVGVRDESKLLCGLGPCGKMLCCGQFLTRFHPVSVRMAKNQDLSLTPEGISGVCGRLMCCLAYENDVYLALRKNLPKLKSRVTLKDGREGLVRGLFPLVNRVEILFGDGLIETMDLDKLAGEFVGTVNPDAEERADGPEGDDEAARGAVASTGLSRGKRCPPTRCARPETGGRGEARPSGASGGATRDGSAGQAGERRGERTETRGGERAVERARGRKRPAETAETEGVTPAVIEIPLEAVEPEEGTEGVRKRPSRRRRRGGKGGGTGGEAGSQSRSDTPETAPTGVPALPGGDGAFEARGGDEGGDDVGDEESSQAEPGKPPRRRRRRRQRSGARREGEGNGPDGAAPPSTSGES
ncbi:MAG: hypothetical protein HQL97_14040 [Magnetococcales bacterium]|nr:hypothetical protein [Magnetococcales bacterium]